MNKYNNMIIQKSISQELKLKSFYLLDLAIVFGPTVFLIVLQGNLRLPLVTSILIGVLLIALGLFLCAKPASNGGSRNLYTIYCLLVMDRRIYEVQSYQSSEVKVDSRKRKDDLKW